MIKYNAMLRAALVLGFSFSSIASLAAFLISYEEYSRHYKDKRKALRLSLKTAIFAFIVFFTLAIIIGFFIDRALAV